MQRRFSQLTTQDEDENEYAVHRAMEKTMEEVIEEEDHTGRLSESSDGLEYDNDTVPA